MRIAPHEPPGQRLGIGIKQKLVRIEAKSVFRLIAAVYAIAIGLPGFDLMQVTVPHVLATFGHCYALELAAALAVEQAELDFFGVCREQRKVRAPPVPGRTKRMGQAGRQLHVTTTPARETAPPTAGR